MEFTPETTIGQAKERYAQEYCEGQAANIKMIFKAKLLQNDVTIGSLNLGEKDFIVVHTPKPSAKPQPTPTPEPQATTQPANPQSQPLPTTQPLPVEQPLPTAQPLPVNPGGLPSGAGGFPGGIPNLGGLGAGPAPGTGAAAAAGGDIADSPEFQQNINTLMELGFAKDDCEAALRAAYGNSDRAAEYLFSGNIPDPEETEDDENIINSMRILQASLLIEPRALENLVEMIEQREPAVRQNPEVILERFGNLPRDKFDLDGIKNRTVQPLSPAEFQQVQMRAVQTLGLAPGGPAPGGAAPGGPDPAPGFTPGPAPGPAPGPGFAPGPAPGERPVQGAEAILAQLPQEDQEAIRRLQQLGNFPLLEVIQIYQACDKNENQAANILFSNQE